MEKDPPVLPDKVSFSETGVKYSIVEPEFQASCEPSFLPPVPKPPGAVTLPCLLLHHQPRPHGITTLILQTYSRRGNLQTRGRHTTETKSTAILKGNFERKPPMLFLTGQKKEAKGTFTTELNEDSFILQCCLSFWKTVLFMLSQLPSSELSTLQVLW